jgi:hypothetical protein
MYVSTGARPLSSQPYSCAAHLTHQVHTNTEADVTAETLLTVGLPLVWVEILAVTTRPESMAPVPIRRVTLIVGPSDESPGSN